MFYLDFVFAADIIHVKNLWGGIPNLMFIFWYKHNIWYTDSVLYLK